MELPAYDPDYVPTAEDHFEVDNITVDEASKARSKVDRPPEQNALPLQATEALDPGEGGSWSPAQEWPVLGVHVALLPSGKVMVFDSVSDALTEDTPVHDRTRVMLWDPVTHWITRVDLTGWNIFCSGHAFLPDGSLYVAGGTLNSDVDGLDKTFVFDPQSNTWTQEATMAVGRWYPTVTALGNGEMLITAGRIDMGHHSTFPEIRGVDGNLRSLTGASMVLPFYPWMQNTPNGKALVLGPATATYLLDPTGLGSWQSTGNRDSVSRTSGSFALYDIGKFISAGGGSSRASATLTDVNSGLPVNTPTGSMAFGRRHFDLTVLADGTVLATGGNSSGVNHVDLSASVYAAEVWNPTTGTWRTLNSMQITRQYHSTALLLPDGRVLTSGGGLSDITEAAGYLEKNAEVFSPPYLFKKDGSGDLAPRPVINSAPTSVNYAANFSVNMQNSTPIQKVGFVRLGATTHSLNMDQRYVPLNYTQSGSTLQITAPANGNIAPPGYYMLFVIDNQGVPSVARMVQIRQTSTPPASDLIFSDGFDAGNLAAWSAASTDGDDLAAQSTAALFGSHGLRAEIDDNTSIFVTDSRPNAERRYRARFYFDPNSVTMAQGNYHNIFRGYTSTWMALLTLDFRFYDSRYQVRAGVVRDDNTWRYTPWFDISDAPHALEVDWQAATASGANNGALTFWIDGAQRPALTNIDNNDRVIETVRMGAVSGIDTGTRGHTYFDAFEARRQSYIGPLTSAATSQITLVTDPPGLQLTLNGQTVNTPHIFQSPEGQQHTLGVVSPQTVNGVSHTWQSWSDGGSATHSISVPTNDQTYTARFAPATQVDAIFADGFENGNLQAWSVRGTDGGDLLASSTAALVGNMGMLAGVDDNNPLYVGDNRPDAERRYRARFYFDPNTMSMAHGNQHELFRGFQGTWPAVLDMQVRYYNSAYQVRAGLLNDGTTWRYSAWFILSDAPHALEVDWRASTAAGANNGQLTFWIDGVQRSNLTGIDNDTRQIDMVRLGAISSIDTGTRGSYHFDDFVSRRESYIGPAAGTTFAADSATDPAEVNAWTEEEMDEDDNLPLPEEEEEGQQEEQQLFVPWLHP